VQIGFSKSKRTFNRVLSPWSCHAEWHALSTLDGMNRSHVSPFMIRCQKRHVFSHTTCSSPSLPPCSTPHCFTQAPPYAMHSDHDPSYNTTFCTALKPRQSCANSNIAKRLVYRILFRSLSSNHDKPNARFRLANTLHKPQPSQSRSKDSYLVHTWLYLIHWWLEELGTTWRFMINKIQVGIGCGSFESPSQAR
jgi:hypothetical protein